MSDPTHRWAEELKESVDLVKTMRDELKVQLHIANMEARAQFEALERRLDNEQLNARKSFRELISGFREVKNQLTRSVKKSLPGRLRRISGAVARGDGRPAAAPSRPHPPRR